MIEAVIFDVDGVLTDSEPLHLEATNRVLANLGKALDEEENKEYLGLDERDFWKKVVARFELEADPESLGAQRIAEYLELVQDGLLPMPGVPECITGMLMRGLSLAAASSSSRKVVDATLVELGLKKSFQVVVCGDEVRRSKPDPEIFLKAAEGLGVQPDQCLVIEDSPNGIQAAREAGMLPVAVLNQYNFDLDLTAAERIFSGLAHFDWNLFEER
ncbi:MAG: HAD family hydrolase [Planctomycetota bacterium]|jgi:HAD superfamily hydrolase (TIGR01509 family)